MTNTNVGWLLKGLEHQAGWDSDHHTTRAQLKRVHPPKSYSSGGKMEEQMEGQMEGMEANQVASQHHGTRQGDSTETAKRSSSVETKQIPAFHLKLLSTPPHPHPSLPEAPTSHHGC